MRCSQAIIIHRSTTDSQDQDQEHPRRSRMSSSGKTEKPMSVARVSEYKCDCQREELNDNETWNWNDSVHHPRSQPQSDLTWLGSAGELLDTDSPCQVVPPHIFY